MFSKDKTKETYEKYEKEYKRREYVDALYKIDFSSAKTIDEVEEIVKSIPKVPEGVDYEDVRFIYDIIGGWADNAKVRVLKADLLEAKDLNLCYAKILRKGPCPPEVEEFYKYLKEKR